MNCIKVLLAASLLPSNVRYHLQSIFKFAIYDLFMCLYIIAKNMVCEYDVSSFILLVMCP